MGGLVILKGLVNRIRNEHGSTHPVNAVRWITLYSSPLLGSAVANVVSFTISAIPVLRQLMKWLPGNQLYDLRRGDFVEQLVGDTESLIYQPTENALLMNGRIPVRACYAKQDNVVAKKSAIGFLSPIHLQNCLKGLTARLSSQNTTEIHVIWCSRTISSRGFVVRSEGFVELFFAITT